MTGTNRRSVEDELRDLGITVDKVLLTAERNETKIERLEVLLKEVIRRQRRADGFTTRGQGDETGKAAVESP